MKRLALFTLPAILVYANFINACPVGAGVASVGYYPTSVQFAPSYCPAPTVFSAPAPPVYQAPAPVYAPPPVCDVPQLQLAPSYVPSFMPSYGYGRSYGLGFSFTPSYGYSGNFGYGQSTFVRQRGPIIVRDVQVRRRGPVAPVQRAPARRTEVRQRTVTIQRGTARTPAALPRGRR